MSFLELAKKRSSIRAYDPRPVPPEMVAEVLEAGRVAPSACNKQPWHFILITEPEARQRLSAVYAKEWFYSAPVILVVCVEPSKAWTRADGVNFAWVDGAIALDHMTLCATDLGLGSCWIGAFKADKLREILQLPEGIEVVGMTPLGYPAAAGMPKNRKAPAEIIHRERW